jgi:hypothetical protein
MLKHSSKMPFSTEAIKFRAAVQISLAFKIKFIFIAVAYICFNLLAMLVVKLKKNLTHLVSYFH